MNQCRDAVDCPSCGANGNHRSITAPALNTEASKPATDRSFTYNLGSNLDQAARVRSENEAMFGTYNEFTGSRRGAPRRIIDPDADITYHGDADAKTAREVADNKHQA